MINLSPSTLAVGGKKAFIMFGVVVCIAAVMRLSTSSFRSSASILIPRIVKIIWLELRAVGIGFSYSG
ncbi:MAG: hypothetical protein CM1200mP35_01440 [Chloroflexota bacterium]|nr:MAG: hypothetical protein CM1200mP35_01440 [Chloroflexota bacterium]